jgi:hypothetical protein
MLQHGKPREIDTKSHEVLFLYTDASYSPEEETGGVGGVLCAADGKILAWFGEEVSPSVCKKLKAEGQSQIIGELEALAVLVALKTWADKICSKHLVAFIDNEGSKFSILKGYSRNPALSKIVSAIASAEEAATCFCWYSRIPSECNPADGPSRGKECEGAVKGSRVRVDVGKLEAQST